MGHWAGSSWPGDETAPVLKTAAAWRKCRDKSLQTHALNCPDKCGTEQPVSRLCAKRGLEETKMTNLRNRKSAGIAPFRGSDLVQRFGPFGLFS
jgi:hypothetical protein